MVRTHVSITDEQAALIENSPLFFVASADPELQSGPDGTGPVNISPRGGVPLHILDRNRVVFLDYSGSGNETARHSSAGGPMTIMVCSFEEGNAAIVRLYGNARVMPLENSPIADLLLRNATADLKLPTRQIVEVDVEKTTTACGFGVPVMSFVRDRMLADRGLKYKGS
ncbi:MAG: pyridoxamine 5'-phosphate oxidase family protein [SAR202 cluster bacterium]|nr:pyridoxamine 5'-phosphate oxidase family protein [SAR202 cluster bacterium]